jgi:hypothetical protein
LVFVDAVIPGRVPPFEEVESEVTKAWHDDQEAQAWAKAFESMRARYTVLLPSVPDDIRTTSAKSVAPDLNPAASDLLSGGLQ